MKVFIRFALLSSLAILLASCGTHIGNIRFTYKELCTSEYDVTCLPQARYQYVQNFRLKHNRPLLSAADLNQLKSLPPIEPITTGVDKATSARDTKSSTPNLVASYIGRIFVAETKDGKSIRIPPSGNVTYPYINSELIRKIPTERLVHTEISGIEEKAIKIQIKADVSEVVAAALTGSSVKLPDQLKADLLKVVAEYSSSISSKALGQGVFEYIQLDTDFLDEMIENLSRSNLIYLDHGNKALASCISNIQYADNTTTSQTKSDHKAQSDLQAVSPLTMEDPTDAAQRKYINTGTSALSNELNYAIVKRTETLSPTDAEGLFGFIIGVSVLRTSGSGLVCSNTSGQVGNSGQSDAGLNICSSLKTSIKATIDSFYEKHSETEPTPAESDAQKELIAATVVNSFSVGYKSSTAKNISLSDHASVLSFSYIPLISSKSKCVNTTDTDKPDNKK